GRRGNSTSAAPLPSSATSMPSASLALVTVVADPLASPRRDGTSSPPLVLARDASGHATTSDTNTPASTPKTKTWNSGNDGTAAPATLPSRAFGRRASSPKAEAAPATAPTRLPASPTHAASTV